MHLLGCYDNMLLISHIYATIMLLRSQYLQRGLLVAPILACAKSTKKGLCFFHACCAGTVQWLWSRFLLFAWWWLDAMKHEQCQWQLTSANWHSFFWVIEFCWCMYGWLDCNYFGLCGLCGGVKNYTPGDLECLLNAWCNYFEPWTICGALGIWTMYHKNFWCC